MADDNDEQLLALLHNSLDDLDEPVTKEEEPEELESPPKAVDDRRERLKLRQQAIKKQRLQNREEKLKKQHEDKIHRKYNIQPVSLYMDEYRADLVSNHPHLSSVEINILLNRAWRDEPADIKKSYECRARELEQAMFERDKKKAERTRKRKNGIETASDNEQDALALQLPAIPIKKQRNTTLNKDPGNQCSCFWPRRESRES